MNPGMLLDESENEEVGFVCLAGQIELNNSQSVSS